MTFSIILGLCIIIALILWFVGYYYLLKYLTSVEEAWETIEEQFKRRHDMTDELRAVMQPHVALTNDVQDKLDEAIEGMVSPFNSRNEQMDANDELAVLLREVMESAQGHPELVNDPDFKRIFAELDDSAYKIAAARKVYNNTVTKYNKKIQTMPTSFVANVHHFTTREAVSTAL
ncbi:LemA family protein [Salsuginibacillus kocurii]|uniref:LemA family protein n=1 Tax=Salsuginibacillus kocurii TaxID=427078 RepID=UPI00037A9A7C|nr:LemA family protein [Salsuginibacillus kocurii]